MRCQTVTYQFEGKTQIVKFHLSCRGNFVHLYAENTYSFYK
jgi:hypothetical protein